MVRGVLPGIVLVVAVGVPALGQEAALAAPPPAVVERVVISGAQHVPAATLLYYVSTKAGDRYDEMRLKDDFRRLWDAGFLEDLLLDVRDEPAGKVVTFVVRERKRVQIVDFRGGKSVTTTNIEDKLKELEAGIRIDSFYDPSKAKKVESIIKRMLEEKGRPSPPSNTTPSPSVRRACRSRSSSTRARGQGQGDRLHRQHGLLRRKAAREDEEDQGGRRAAVLLLHRAPALGQEHLQRGKVGRSARG